MKSFLAPSDIVKTRIDICKNCEFNKFKVCTKCGCFIKLKTRFLQSNCPINRWESPLNSWTNIKSKPE